MVGVDVRVRLFRRGKVALRIQGATVSVGTGVGLYLRASDCYLEIKIPRPVLSIFQDLERS